MMKDSEHSFDLVSYWLPRPMQAIPCGIKALVILISNEMPDESTDQSTTQLTYSNRIPRRLSVWGPSCQTHSRKAIGHPDGSVHEHLPLPTLGPQARDSPCCFPSPLLGNHRLLKRKTTEVSLSRPGGHSTTAHPLRGGGFTRSHWTVNLQENPLHLQKEVELPQPGSNMPMLDQLQAPTV